MYYLKNKRDKVCHCNICGSKTALSWDHVPPKGGIELTPVEQETVFQHLVASPEESHKYFESQNGVKFRTICSDCNNALGRSFDPVLNEFALSVGRMLNTSLVLPERVFMKTKPNRLVRSIFGHLLSSKSEREDTVSDQLMRSVVLDISKPVPSDLQVFYWVHPYSYIVVIRDVGMPAVRGVFKEIAIFSILKYFPVGYLVTSLSAYEGLDSLSHYLSTNIDDEQDIPIFLKKARHAEWPEMIDPGNMMFGGQSILSAVAAKPRLKGRTAPANQAL